METHIVNTNPNNCDSEGSAMIYFQADTIQLANGSTLERYSKLDYSKEYATGRSYETRKQWESAIKRAKKQFAEFN